MRDLRDNPVHASCGTDSGAHMPSGMAEVWLVLKEVPMCGLLSTLTFCAANMRAGTKLRLTNRSFCVMDGWSRGAHYIMVLRGVGSRDGQMGTSAESLRHPCQRILPPPGLCPSS